MSTEYDKDLAVHKTAYPTIKVGEKIPFTTGDYYITAIELEPYKHSIVTMAEKMDGPAICYLHNSIRYAEEGV
tara:strand:+ start:315 stop:533 length:219 start_codon:yes stop_codon:yes gene_type:complete